LIGEVRRREKQAAPFARHIKASSSQGATYTAAAEQILIQDEIRYGWIGHVAGRLRRFEQIEESTGRFHRAHVVRKMAFAVPLCERGIGRRRHCCASCETARPRRYRSFRASCGRSAQA